MNEEEIFQQQQNHLAMENMALQMQMGQQNPQQNDPNMIREQLSLGDEMETIDNLLNSRVLAFNPETKKREWKDPEDEDMILLSPYGVHHFRQAITGYINKNKLLSNYEEEMVLDKMRDIATVLNDDFMMLYDKIFYVPSVKWCLSQIEEELKETLEIKKIAYKIANKEFNQAEEEEKLLGNLEESMEVKIKEVRNKAFDERITKMNFLLRFIQDAIHDTYNRALKGQERRSLRQTMSITESRGGLNFGMQPTKKKTFGIFKGVGR